MSYARMIFLLFCLIASLAQPAFAEADDRPLMKLPQEIEYTGAADQLQTAVVFGDPTKPGLYVQRFRFPLGLKVPPHWHPEEMRTVVVLSGTLYYAFGERALVVFLRAAACSAFRVGKGRRSDPAADRDRTDWHDRDSAKVAVVPRFVTVRAPAAPRRV